MNWLPIMFALNFSLLLLHEMDAVRAKEWNMLAILKNMKDSIAFIVFSLIHLPLYAWVIYTVSQTWSIGYAFVWLLVDVFLIVHAAIHFFFRKHTANGFKSAYSNILIYAMCALSALHLAMML